jgi:hypothetical protein
VASPGQLVDVISQTLGVPRATVALHDRNLAEAGLRKMGGRGPSAATMDSVDAANLLIAVVAAPINGPAIASSAAACDLYSKLQFRRGQSTSIRIWRDVKLWGLAALTSDHTFGEVLTALIDAERAGELEESARGARFWHFLISIRAPFPYVEITFDVPSIHIEMKYGDEVPQQEEYRMPWYSARESKFQAGDLRQTRSFTHLTIREVGVLLGKLYIS